MAEVPCAAPSVKGADSASKSLRPFDCRRIYYNVHHACLYLEAGKAVLCEKPMSVNAADVHRMRDCAQAHGQFLMEAIWTRFLPVTVGVRRWLAEGLIGKPRAAIIDHGFRCDRNPASRLLNPELAGGGLLDVGIYPPSSKPSTSFGTRASCAANRGEIERRN